MTPVIPLIPVGPGHADRQRLPRLLRALLRHEPNLDALVIVHDGVPAETVAREVAEAGGPKPLLVENPRPSHSRGDFDGLACGLIEGYRQIARQFPGAHAWKIDTDAYIIGPCRLRIAGQLDARPRVGLIGTVDHDCDGTPRDDAIRRLGDVHRKFLWPIWYWRSLRRVTSPWLSSGRRFAELFRSVDRAGGRRGRYVQGGSYAVNATVLADWLGRGWLDDGRWWIDGPVSEDFAFSLLCAAADFEMADFNRPCEVFGVKNIGLPLPPAELLARGYGVVHSVKTNVWNDELTIITALDQAMTAAVP